MIGKIEQLLGDDKNLLTHKCKTIPKSRLCLRGPNFVDDVMSLSDRSPLVMRSLNWLLTTGRLGGTGYVSILPVDQGIEHSGGASFAPNPDYFDPARIVELAKQYKSSLFFTKDDREVDGSSILSILTLACPKGTELEVRVVGEDSKELLERVNELFEQNFGEQK